MSRKLVYASFVTVLACRAFGQAPAFDAASVKPDKSGSGSSHTDSHNGVYRATNENLKSLIQMAYQVRDYQIAGPDWLSSERFDIAARPPAGSKDEDLGPMLQSLLLERFRLALHRQTKEFPVYGLLVAKNGPKFKEVEDTGGQSTNSNRGRFIGKRCSMASFAAYLARQMERPVVDMTGLTGVFDLKLNFTPENVLAAREDTKADAEAYPPLLTALQEQLGLKLDPKKAPIEMLVIDHIERVPTEN
jgi:uncharacterized protein (TIGR03435 family)